jgi:hypothetical protein
MPRQQLHRAATAIPASNTGNGRGWVVRLRIAKLITIMGPVSAQNRKLVASPKTVALNRLNRAGSAVTSV